MAFFMHRPQETDNVLLNIGDEYGRPHEPHGSGGGVSPGVDSEIINDGGLISSILFESIEDGSGFVLVQES